MTYQSGSGRSDWLLNTVKQNPEGLLLLAAGAALLMRRGGPSTPAASMPSSYPQPHTGSAPHGTGTRDTAAGYAEQVSETARSYAASASEFAQETGRSAGEQSQRMVRSAQSTLQSSMDRILQDQPLAIALAGLAAGAAVAAAFPATAMERQTLGPIGSQISEAAGHMGEQLQQATAKAGEKLKSAAQERGLNADGLKEVVSEAAGAFSDSMSGKQDQESGSGFESPALNQPGPDQNR
jgi:hypothetical protein